MLRRSLRSATTLDQTKQQLAQQESQLRDQVQKLEKMIEAGPRLVEQAERRQREELLTRAGQERNRLDVSISVHDKRYDGGFEKRRGSLRKERREGRIVFLVLVIVLVAGAIWLAMHMPHF